MLLRRKSGFATVRTEGALLPPDVLVRIASGDASLPATTPASYHLGPGEKLHDAANRAWSRLLPAWRAFRSALAAAGGNDASNATSLTREKWLAIVFQELGFGRLERENAREIPGSPGKTYPISHAWRKVPIHLVGVQTPIDRRSEGVAGAARTSPHGLVQEFLNRTDDALWGIVSNGELFRLLRDNVRLTRPAFVDFDLKSMFDGEVYSDFVLFWLICHQSRFEPFESERPAAAECEAGRLEDLVLERWSKAAHEEGTRVLERLRDGVQSAIADLGRGFLAHASNRRLRDRLKAGDLATQDYYRQLLRFVYRLIFQFVAEDRDLLLDPKAADAAKDAYRRWYSTARLRKLAEKRRGSRHEDLKAMLDVTWRRLGKDEGCPALALPALGSFLWSDAALEDLAGAALANDALLDAVYHLAFAVEGGTRRAVDWKGIGPEELGSVYESLLELHPELNVDAATFELKSAAGNERKSTGSYYTPDSLVQCLLDTALDAVLDEAARGDDAREATRRILALKVCDPACGSGHFLISAAHRIGKRLAQVATGDDEPSPDELKKALRQVIGNCIFGVDKNEMAVELCKVSLWLEALVPGMPLNFLEDKILCGDALLGTTPALVKAGIPDDAFDPIEGDDKPIARELKKKNKEERKVGQGQFNFAAAAERTERYGGLTALAREIDALGDEAIPAVREKEARWRRLHDSLEYRDARWIADGWCSAFVWRKTKDAPPGVTTGTIRALQRKEDSAHSRAQRDEIEALRDQYGFFHWHVEFPQVFEVGGDAKKASAAGWNGGFDVVLGNPPWERVKLQEQEFFAARDPEIANAPNAAARRTLIARLNTENPSLSREFGEALREAEGASHFVRNSGRFPLCGRGDVNTYSVFAETMRMLIGPRGRVGCIVPSGVATDDTTKFFFQDLMERGSLQSLFEFENEGFFTAGKGHMLRFALTTICGAEGRASEARFLFKGMKLSDLAESDRIIALTGTDIRLLNPNTMTCPVFTSRRDAEITKSVYRRVPVLIEEGPPERNPWGLTFATMFHMSGDSELFRTREQLDRDGWTLSSNIFTRGRDRYLPLYEAKMIHQFDHRFGDYADVADGKRAHVLPDVSTERHTDPSYVVTPYYWVPDSEVDSRLAQRWARGWLLGWRDVTDSRASARTVIASIVPRGGVGDKYLLMLPAVGAQQAAVLAAMLDSLPFDYIARQKVGGNSLKFFTMKQLAALPPSAFDSSTPWSSTAPVRDWIAAHVLELAYTSHDLAPFARDLGYKGPPLLWNEERRFQLRCELDAAFFHLYGVNRDDAEYILGTFPVVRRNEEKKWGEFRTRRVVLEMFEGMASSRGPARGAGSTT